MYLPALLGIAGFSVLSAPLGAKLAHRLPAQQLRRLFAVFLAGLGLYMLFLICRALYRRGSLRVEYGAVKLFAGASAVPRLFHPTEYLP